MSLCPPCLFLHRGSMQNSSRADRFKRQKAPSIVQFQIFLEKGNKSLFKHAPSCCYPLFSLSFLSSKCLIIARVKVVLVCPAVFQQQAVHSPLEQQKQKQGGGGGGPIPCQNCGKPCKGEALRVQNKHFHIKCFACKGM